MRSSATSLPSSADWTEETAIAALAAASCSRSSDICRRSIVQYRSAHSDLCLISNDVG